MHKIFIFFFTCCFVLSCTKKKDDNKVLNTLNWALTTSVSTLDPAVSYDTVSSKVVSQIYETLYEYDYLIRPYQITPLLAEDLPSISADGLKYTIKIKEGISYHDSKAFAGKKRFVKSMDFVNELKRIAFKPTKSNGWWLFTDKIKGLDKFREIAKSDMSDFFTIPIEGLKTPNDQTLIIELKQPYPQLQYALAMSFTAPVPEEVIKFYNNDLNHESVGTGAFKFIHWNKNLDILLEKHSDYHKMLFPSKGDRLSFQQNLLEDRGKQLPFVEKIHFQIIKEAQTRWLKFLNKEIDVMVLSKDHFSVALDTTGQLNKEYLEKNIKLQIAPTLTYWWLAFNMNHKILGSNLMLRKAIAHAVNIDEYILKFTNNIALKANSIYPPGVLGYSPANELPYQYDIKKAKEYLAKAGFPNGKGLPEFSYDVRGSSTTSRQMGEFIIKELAAIGIKLNLNLNTFPGFLNKARTGQLEIWQGGWALDYPDPENVIQLLTTKNHSPGPNSTFYSNKVVDELYQKLFYTNDKDQALLITDKVQDLVNQDLPWVMQFYSRNYILHQGYVKNFRQSDLINNNFKYLRIK